MLPFLIYFLVGKLIFQKYEMFWFIRWFLVLHCKDHSLFCTACICLDKQIKPQSVKNEICGMQRELLNYLLCSLSNAFGSHCRAVTPLRVSGVCQDSQMWPILSVPGNWILWGPSWGGLMWAVCSWCLCSHICIVSRCYLTHLLLISCELLIFHKHCANPPGNTIDLCHRY